MADAFLPCQCEVRGKRQAEAVRWRGSWHKRVDFVARPDVGDTLKRERASQASGSTLFICAVCNSIAMVAQVRPPPSLPAKQSILSRNCLWPDGAFDDVGVELDATIGQEAFEDGTARDGVADRRAVDETARGACKLSRTILSFSSSVQRRRRPVSTTSNRST